MENRIKDILSEKGLTARIIIRYRFVKCEFV